MNIGVFRSMKAMRGDDPIEIDLTSIKYADDDYERVVDVTKQELEKKWKEFVNVYVDCITPEHVNMEEILHKVIINRYQDMGYVTDVIIKYMDITIETHICVPGVVEAKDYGVSTYHSEYVGEMDGSSVTVSLDLFKPRMDMRIEQYVFTM